MVRDSMRGAVKDTIPQAVVEAHVLRGVSMVKAWREYLGLTQEDVSARAGMKQPALARIEGGTTSPRPATLSKIAAALGISAAQLEE